MTYAFSKASEAKLKGVHPDLVRVLRLALTRSALDFTVLEGVRTLKRQRMLVATGASKTMNSRHLTGHAVDIAAIVGGRVRWDWPLYQKLADVVMAAAKELAVPLVWGGSWKTFKDGPHFELDRRLYP